MQTDISPVPVIDVFAGPGGLSEGFSSFHEGYPEFEIILSIEKNKAAYQTLELRALYRNIDDDKRERYYEYLRDDIGREELFEKFPEEAEAARKTAWCAELGEEPEEEVDRRIRESVGDSENWVLIGGPPCQLYSLMGRARRSKMREENPEEFNNHPKHFLYRQYLRLLAVHCPTIFVMENVKGMLSAEVNGEPIFSKIERDLGKPYVALSKEQDSNTDLKATGYNVYSFVSNSNLFDEELDPKDYVIEAENYGVPQTRHRVLILGVRKDVDPKLRNRLARDEQQSPVKEVISDLPPIRSKLTRETDSFESWVKAIRDGTSNGAFENADADVMEVMEENLDALEREKTLGGRYVSSGSESVASTRLTNSELEGVCNHEARGHMRSDLHRYLFAASYAKAKNESPVLSDFPKQLLPDHKNIEKALERGTFQDRFRVQVADRPSSTITAHMAKDGHYYIHYDPAQCRSLTVREAARLQTFPDDYFFEGTRTQQYVQVGNAVPPLLSKKIAGIVSEIAREIEKQHLET